MSKAQAGVAAGILIIAALAVGILNFAGENRISGEQVSKTSGVTGFQQPGLCACREASPCKSVGDDNRHIR